MRAVPLKHQFEFLEWIEDRDCPIIIADFGTGKTWMVGAWLEKFYAFPALVITQTSTLLDWAEKFHALSGLDCVVVNGPKYKRIELLCEEHQCYLIAYDTVRADLKELLKIRWKGLVCDESHYIKRLHAKRTKALLKLSEQIPYKCIATATLVTNSLDDLFSQFKLMDGGATLGYQISDFHWRHFIHTDIGWVPRSSSRQFFEDLLQERAYSVRADDVIALPPLEYTVERVNLHEGAKQAYIDLETQLWVEFEGQVVEVRSVLAKIIYLLEIASGFCRNPETKDIFELPCNKPNQLLQLVHRIRPRHSGIVVWTNFKYDVKQVYSVLQRSGMAIFDSARAASKRALSDTINAFQQSERPSVLIASQHRISASVDLTRASAAIYYGRDFSVARREHSEPRIRRIGSEKHEKIEYFDLVTADTLEERVLDQNLMKRLFAKKTVSGDLVNLELLHQRVKEARDADS